MYNNIRLFYAIHHYLAPLHLSSALTILLTVVIYLVIKILSRAL